MKTIRRTDLPALRTLAIDLAGSDRAAIPSAKLIGLFTQFRDDASQPLHSIIWSDLPVKPVPPSCADQARALLDPSLPLPQAMAHLYQDLLSAGFNMSRKTTGSYYTPAWVVDFIVQKTLHPTMLSSSKDGPPPRILDPACGAGFFLTSALDRLVRSGIPVDTALRDCIHGCDLDPVAVYLARLSLSLRAENQPKTLDMIVGNIRVGDSLHGSCGGGYDAIIGNPPYLFGENVASATRGRQEAFGLARGQFDVYWLFFESALKGMLADGGTYGMIVPDAVLARDDSSVLRSELTCKHRLLAIAHLGQVFSGTGVSAAVVVWQKGGEPIGPVRVFSTESGRLTELEPVDQQELGGEAKCRWLVHLPASGRAFLKKIESMSVPLGALVTIRRGEELGTNALTYQTSPDCIPILAGRDIERLASATPSAFVEADVVRKPADIYAGPKLVFVKTGQGIVATVDYSDTVALQSVYLIRVKEGLRESVSLEYLAAILASRVLDWVARRTFTDYKRLFPQFNQTTVKSLPIRKVDFTTPTPRRQELTAQGMRVWDTGDDLTGFVWSRLKRNPEQADVVHDILSDLARTAMESTQLQNKELRLRLLKQIDEIVWLLYGIAPGDLQ